MSILSWDGMLMSLGDDCLGWGGTLLGDGFPNLLVACLRTGPGGHASCWLTISQGSLPLWELEGSLPLAVVTSTPTVLFAGGITMLPASGFLLPLFVFGVLTNVNDLSFSREFLDKECAVVSDGFVPDPNLGGIVLEVSLLTDSVLSWLNCVLASLFFPCALFLNLSSQQPRLGLHVTLKLTEGSSFRKSWRAGDKLSPGVIFYHHKVSIGKWN